MRAWVWAAVAAMCMAFAGPVRAAAPRPADRAAAIRAAVEPIRARAQIPALGLAVIDKGGIAFEGGFGSVAGRPATEHDTYRVASISKLFAGQAAMQLVDQGKLRLDDDIGRWLPAFAGRGITVRQLMTHHSGLRDVFLALDRDEPERVAEYLGNLAAQPAARAGPPGAAYNYTDTDFNLLGAVVAAASGQPFTDYVQAHVFAPLALTETTAFPPKAAREGIVPPTLSADRAGRTPRPYDLAFAPSEGAVTSAHDLAVWTRAVLARDKRLLSRQSHRAMLVGQDNADGPNRYIALAWQMRYEPGSRLVAEHAGSVRGYSALVLTYPEERRAVIVLTNAGDAPRWEIVKAVDEALGR